jgi:channel protein (hemolysin III family)
MKNVLQDISAAVASHALPRKPLMRGWSHALASLASLVLTIALCWQSRADFARLISLLIFGLSMLELYTISALYHIGRWGPRPARVLRAIDHANIFVMIAGTYTPLCLHQLEHLSFSCLSLLLLAFRFPSFFHHCFNSLKRSQATHW